MNKMEDCTSTESCNKPNLLCTYPNCTLGNSKKEEKTTLSYEEQAAEIENLNKVIQQMGVLGMFIEDCYIYFRHDGYQFRWGSRSSKSELYNFLKKRA